MARPADQLLKDIINCSLELAESAVDLVTPDLLLRIVKKITNAILGAFIGTVGSLPIIKDAVFSNDINAATLGLIWSNWAGLARFIVDLVECTKCYVPNDSCCGVAPSNESRVQANELDFSKPMNRHAAICQIQRLALSIIFILTEMTKRVDITTMNESERIEMTQTTTLQSDAKSEPITVSDHGTKLEEKWLFVNGIAGEYHWTRLACQKLARQYSREITGIFNRGDGILWDLVECAGERSAHGEGNARSQKQLIKRTESSRDAQGVLKEKLSQALDRDKGHIVMIAHSQGCLLLRLVLEELLTCEQKYRRTMRQRLCVFTFGNPSVDWAMDDCLNSKSTRPEDCEFCANKEDVCKSLETHVLRTEHFANSEDFVAKLGVLSEPTRKGYGHVFINRKLNWKNGHLFGSQYSLNSGDYGSGQDSWLLDCRKEKSIVHS
ncbi:hypothetical protein N7499_006290 [Penicillium canescens]|nr:hypothetical protein N7499_006290 [Penicillium canescens]